MLPSSNGTQLTGTFSLLNSGSSAEFVGGKSANELGSGSTGGKAKFILKQNVVGSLNIRFVRRIR